MAYLRNVLTGAVVGELADDSAEYYALVAERQSPPAVNLPVWEDIPYEDAVGPLAAAAETGVSIAAVYPAVTIAADLTQVIGASPIAGRLLSASVTPVSAVTGAASPASRTWKVSNLGPGGEVADLASLALLSGVNPAADVASPLTVLDDAATALEINALDVIQFSSTHVGGTGLVDPGGIVTVTIAPTL